MIRISVIIVNYNARYFLKNCLNSVLSSDISECIEIIVVDNDSNDGSCDMLARDFPEVQCLRNDENVGFARANNRAVKEAKGAYVLILNPDTMVCETTLSDILHFGDQQKNFGAAGVQFIDGSGAFLPESKRNLPDVKMAAAKLLGFSKYYYANHIGVNDTAQVDVLTGAFMFVAKDVYDAVGGFDEDFFMYGEDIDLSYRIVKAGFKNFYVGASKVLHFKGESTIKDKFYLENFYGALSIFYKKHFSNRLGLYLVVDKVTKFMISFKSVSKGQIDSRIVPDTKVFYFGGNSDMLGRLKSTFPNVLSDMVFNFDGEMNGPKAVFFDSESESYAHIIDAMSGLDFSNFRKRIISKDHQYYIGSDTANDRGEVVQF